MKRRRHPHTVSLVLAAIIFALSFNIASANSQTLAARKSFVCPPCDCGNDATVYEHPGGCPSCSMALIEKGGTVASQSAQTPRPPRKKAAILIFEGVQIIDYTGPFEVFGQAGLDVFTVSASTSPITTSMGMRVIPKFSFDNAPQADILLIPGGDVQASYENPAVIQWIQEKSKEAE
jgi:hypothetical protein